MRVANSPRGSRSNGLLASSPPVGARSRPTTAITAVVRTAIQPPIRSDNEVQLARRDHHRAFTVRIIARRLACRPCPARFTRESSVRTVCSQVAVGPVCHETSASRPSERTRRAKSIMPLNPSIGMCFVPVLVGEPRVAHKCEHFQPSLYGIRSRSEVV